jgi:ComF family protein
LSFLLDLVYPPKCALCGRLGNDPVCEICFSTFVGQPAERYITPPPLDYACSLFDYTGLAAQAVQRLKYYRVTSLVDWMAEKLRAGADERGLLEVDAILPVPIHWSREAARGFNQAEILCERMPLTLLRKDVLHRVRATRAQVGLSHEARVRNLEGAFSAERVEGLNYVLLVDDVLTSGGTATQCARVLKDSGVTEVGILTFAAERRWLG